MLIIFFFKAIAFIMCMCVKAVVEVFAKFRGLLFPALYKTSFFL